MGEVVNLNRVRKRVAREQAGATASANRAKFGRTKEERASEESLNRQSEKVLDQHRIEREDQS
ncbi:MAG: DUF4169 family protein [Xanthobacteraceae bacterium]|nr:DUF4169 family protein [Xanthobacteraceae bacterium]